MVRILVSDDYVSVQRAIYYKDMSKPRFISCGRWQSMVKRIHTDERLVNSAPKKFKFYVKPMFNFQPDDT